MPIYRTASNIYRVRVVHGRHAGGAANTASATFGIGQAQSVRRQAGMPGNRTIYRREVEVDPSATVTPDTVALVTALDTPTVLAAAVVTPATVAVTTALPTSTVRVTPIPATVALGGITYLHGFGTSGSHASTPDHASLDITGDIEIAVCLSFGAPGFAHILGKGEPDGVSTDSYEIYRDFDNNSILAIAWRTSAGSLKGAQSDPGLVVHGVSRWYRVTVDMDNGSSQHVVSFFYSDESPATDPALVTWTPHSDNTIAGTSDIRVSDDALCLGGNLVVEGFGVDGKIFYAEVRNGIGGTIVANPDFRDRDQWNSDTQFTDSQGRVWTIDSPATWYSGLYLPTPTVLAGARVTPASIALTTSLPAPSPLGAAVLTPQTVATAVSVPSPSITVAPTVTPAVIPLVAALPTPTIDIQEESVATPATVATSVSVPTPAISAGASIAPATVATVTSLPTPLILSAATAFPAVVSLTTALPAPEISAGAVITPTTVGLIVAIPVPDITIAATVLPAVIATLASLPQPSITAAVLVSPDGIALVIAIPTPDLVFPIVYTDQRRQREYATAGRSYGSGGRVYSSTNRDYH